MRLSCSGCRVLRKGCSDDCSIRPCLEWIKSPEAQANATVFLAKFYGRAGLVNLINSGANHLRPAIFRSLLYEACGRILNPIYGSLGLMWSGNWSLCETAVEAVLKGDPITPMATDTAEAKTGPAMKAYDIRHVNKEENSSGSSELRRVKNRTRFKRSGPRSKRTASVEETSHDSSLSHQSETVDPPTDAVGSGEPESEHLAPVEPNLESEDEIELDLTLGFEPIKRFNKVNQNDAGKWGDGDGGGFCKMRLGLDYTVGSTEIGMI